jgi:hypothetical protein
MKNELHELREFHAGSDKFRGRGKTSKKHKGVEQRQAAIAAGKAEAGG